MNRSHAKTAPALSLEERRAQLEKLVREGKVSPAAAALIDFREPTPREREVAEDLVERGTRALKRRSPKAA